MATSDNGNGANNGNNGDGNRDELFMKQLEKIKAVGRKTFSYHFSFVDGKEKRMAGEDFVFLERTRITRFPYINTVLLIPLKQKRNQKNIFPPYRTSGGKVVVNWLNTGLLPASMFYSEVVWVKART